MRILSFGAFFVLATATSLFPSRARAAACKTDGDCGSDALICVRGQCVSPVDPGTNRAPGSLGANERAKGTCVRKCDRANAACLARVRKVGTCVSGLRNRCMTACGSQGKTPRQCSIACDAPDRQSSWGPECAKQGDSAREQCLKQQQACLAPCGAAP